MHFPVVSIHVDGVNQHDRTRRLSRSKLQGVGICPDLRTRRRYETRRGAGPVTAPTSRSDPISQRCGRPARMDHCHPGTN
jgi:hypothetical protein